jgi:hypothetical protein
MHDIQIFDMVDYYYVAIYLGVLEAETALSPAYGSVPTIAITCRNINIPWKGPPISPPDGWCQGTSSVGSIKPTSAHVTKLKADLLAPMRISCRELLLVVR